MVVVPHNPNIPVNADAERVIVLENVGDGLRVRTSEEPSGAVMEHCGALEDKRVRADIQQIMEGGVDAFVRRERRYNNELSTYRAAMQRAHERSSGMTGASAGQAPAELALRDGVLLDPGAAQVS